MPDGQAEAAASTAAYERAVDAAVEALRNDRREEAGLLLWDALQGLDAVDDDDLRRSLAGRLGNVCWQVGFDDLALFALDVAIELGEQAGDARALENDRITLGNVHQRLGNLREAEAAFQLVEESAVPNGNYANAASVSTNLAGILAQEGYLADAAERLERSLEYVEREPFPDTELNTRFLLLQVLESMGESPARILDVAEPLGAWADQLEEPHRARLAEVIEGALAAEPDRRDQFAWLLERV
jgi:tetratricopeptide (TPR) repeat protein